LAIVKGIATVQSKYRANSAKGTQWCLHFLMITITILEGLS
jgi:hypothetical protein